MATTQLQGEKIVTDLLGKDYQVVKMGGYWIIGQPGPDHSFICLSPKPLRKSLDKAIFDVMAVKGS